MPSVRATKATLRSLYVLAVHLDTLVASFRHPPHSNYKCMSITPMFRWALIFLIERAGNLQVSLIMIQIDGKAWSEDHHPRNPENQVPDPLLDKRFYVKPAVSAFISGKYTHVYDHIHMMLATPPV
jgi:hypothetical protein